MRSLWLIATLAVACGTAGTPTEVDGGLATGDGMHRIAVPQAQGTDEVWIYAASPAGTGPFPVVVFAHGQGASTLANCWPDGAPAYGDVAVSQELARDLAGQGYLAVAVFFRNTGDGTPLSAGVKHRDHATLDARTVLAAAQWARTQHGAGSERVALLGVSMGSFPAFLAGTARPELADLQDGLDLRLSVIAGMAGNHVANFHRNVGDLLASADANQRAQGIIGVTVALPSMLATRLGLERYRLADVALGQPLGDALAVALTPRGRQLFEDLLLRPSTELPYAPCDDARVAAVCVPACAQALALDRFDDLASLPTVTDWLTDDAIAAAQYWDPPGAIDPRDSAPGSTLAFLRALSPVYGDHTMLVDEVVPLLSTGDHVIVAQGPSATELLLDWLAALGVTVRAEVPVIASDARGPCEHGDYFLPARPTCGWDATVAALARRLR